MSIAQSMLPEFDQEIANTRKVLERVPEDKWNWKPHEKSGTAGWLAGHVGTVPGWITMTLTSESLDYAPVDGPNYEPPKIENTKQLLAAFDKESAEVLKSRGDLLVSPDSQGAITNRFTASLVWMDARPLDIGRRYLLKHTSRIVPDVFRSMRCTMPTKGLADPRVLAR